MALDHDDYGQSTHPVQEWESLHRVNPAARLDSIGYRKIPRSGLFRLPCPHSRGILPRPGNIHWKIEYG
jgi:hypothetical protein